MSKIRSILFPSLAIVAFVLSSGTASACRIYGVEGYTGGPSVVRMVKTSGKPCVVRHYTHLVGPRSARVVETRRFVPVKRPKGAKLTFAGNRAIYRGRPANEFAYRFADRAGYVHDVEVRVARR